MAKPGTISNIKFRKLVTRLAMPAPHVLGHLEFIWDYGNDMKSDLLGSKEDVELIAEWTGEKGKLFKALKTFHWIDQDSDGNWRIHDFTDHCNYYTKKVIEGGKENGLDNKGVTSRNFGKVIKSSKKVENISSNLAPSSLLSPSPLPLPNSNPPPSPQKTSEEDDRCAWELLRSEKEKWSDEEIALSMVTMETRERTKAETVRIAISNANHKQPGNRKAYIRKQLEKGVELRRGATLIHDPAAARARQANVEQKERDEQSRIAEYQRVARDSVAALGEAEFERLKQVVIDQSPEWLTKKLTNGEQRQNERLIYLIYDELVRLKRAPNAPTEAQNASEEPVEVAK